MARRPAGQHGGAPGQRQPEHVAEIVPGVGEQRQRSDQQTGRGFGDDIGDIKADPDREGAVVIGAPMAVRMAVRVLMPGGAAVRRSRRVRMIGVQIGLRHAAASANAGGWLLTIDRIWCVSAPASS